MSRRRKGPRCSRCPDHAMPACCGPRTRLPAAKVGHMHGHGRPRYTSTSSTKPPGTVTLAPDITFAWLLGTSHGHTPSTIHIRRQAWQGHARVRHALLLRSRLLQTVAPKHRSKLKLCQQAGQSMDNSSNGIVSNGIDDGIDGTNSSGTVGGIVNNGLIKKVRQARSPSPHPCNALCACKHSTTAPASACPAFGPCA